MDRVTIINGDCRDVLRRMPDQSVHCCVTSPPYFGLRDYGVDGQIGLEPTPDEFVAALVAVFREVRRVLRDDGTLWLNLGDSYAANRSYQVEQTKGGPKHGPAQAVSGRSQKASDYGLKTKDLIGIPWRVAFALQEDGWYLRQDLIWHKPNPMPESVTDRCTKAHEYLFLLAKSARYHFENGAISEPAVVGFNGSTFVKGKTFDAANALASVGRGERTDQATRNRRSVWSIATEPFRDAHFAVFPPALVEPCILAGCPRGGTVLDPFGGSGTTGLVADRLGRNAILIELNPDYAAMARRRIEADAPLFASVELEPTHD